MFSFLKKVVTAVVPWSSDQQATDLDAEEQAIIGCLKTLNVDTEETPAYPVSGEQKLFGQSDLVQYDVEAFKCVHKVGRVTHLCNECGLIDEVVYFEPNQIKAGLEVKVGDEVLYSAYRVKENESERVYRVYALKNDAWNSDNGLDTGSGLPKLQAPEEIPAIKRIITGRVSERRGREVYIDSANIWCNLDKIQASYIPVEGDWVEVAATVSLSEESADLTGDVLEVKSLKPLLLKSGFGRVTLWTDAKKEGAIENIIYFTQVSCEEGYIPALGDEVVYDAVESDQERFKWRALKVLANSAKAVEKDMSLNKSDESSDIDICDPFGDKNGITIVPAMCAVEIELNQIKRVTFEVTNNGTVKQLLKFTKFQMRRNSQLELLKPKLNDYFFLRPKESVLYEFQCEGKYLGLTGEVFYFYFKGFTIVKRFEINVVGNRDMNRLLTCKFDITFKVFKDQNRVKDEVEPDAVLYGPRPWKPPKFVAGQRKCVFKVPKKLWNIMGGEVQGLKRIKALTDYAPFLKTDLNFEQYADRFHTLLFLEEIDLRINFRKYDMEGVFLDRQSDYLSLDVPGLVERRPSLIVGDKVVLTQPWTEGGKVKHIGFIHDIQEKAVFLKFHDSFHQNYDGSECNVAFEPNTNFFSRCHEAVNRAVKVLGQEWLFPTAVNEKPPQINFSVPEEEKTVSENVANFFKAVPKSQVEKKVIPVSQEVREIESSLKVKSDAPAKNLVWVNKNLNERQKMAVVNVMRGKGRPLPYIIFGPPGTGKTVTLVEIIIQIYRMMPESRILVTTPSNSAADLICERLIDLGNFRPGQLVRLVALYRVFEGLVPTKLIPYSTFFSPKESHGKNLSDLKFRANIKGSSFSELTGRHRITIATCVTIGVLHYSGISPGHFTHILVDEAGQTSEPEVLITSSFQNIHNGQVVLTGDPQQLGPVVCSNTAKSFGLGTSLLQRLISTFPYIRDLDGFPSTSGFDPRFITKLNINYRCVPEILSLPSQLFYNSDLIPTVSQTVGEEATIIEKFNFQAENRTTPPAIIFHGIIGQNFQESDSPSWFNPHEIWQAVFYIRKLYSVGLNCDHIGIVSPYAKQVQKLKQLLPALELSVPKIGSVEEFQGQERHVIIVSTVRSSAKYVNTDIAHSLGFVASPQRLNVALTRARALLIILGNPFLLSKDPYWVNVVKYCVKNNSYTGCNMDAFDEKKIESDKKNNEATDESEDVISDVPE